MMSLAGLEDDDPDHLNAMPLDSSNRVRDLSRIPPLYALEDAPALSSDCILPQRPGLSQFDTWNELEAMYLTNQVHEQSNNSVKRLVQERITRHESLNALQKDLQTRVCEFRPPGAERARQKQNLIEGLLHKRCRLLFIKGKLFSGKRFFANQMIQDLRRWYQDAGGSLEDVVVRCLGIHSWQSLMASLASGLGCPQPYTDNALKTRVCEITSSSKNVCTVLLFTNFEDLIPRVEIIRRLSLLIEDLLDTCPNLVVLVTSRVHVDLSTQKYALTCELEPLSEVECLQLLQPVRHLCKTLEPIYQIVRQCDYRPGLILHIRKIVESHGELMTLEDIAKALQKPEGVLNLFDRFVFRGESLSETIKNQLRLLTPDLQSETRLLCYLDGSFGVKDVDSSFKLNTLLPLKEHCIVRISSRGQQIEIDPLIKDFVLKDLKHLPVSDPCKQPVVKYLGQVLMNLRLDISVQTKGRAWGIVHVNYDCLDRMLTQAVHTSGEETYNVYMKLLYHAEGSISAVCPERAIPFYEAMVEASTRFGSSRDQAWLKGLHAIALIELNGDQLATAKSMMADAVRNLPSDDLYLRVVLMRRQGWMNIRTGHYKEAKRFLTDTLEVSRLVPEDKKAKVEYHQVHIKSHLAIAEIFLGQDYPKVHRLLTSTIVQAKRIVSDHPVLAILLQSFGLLFKEEGELVKALNCFKASEHIRRKYVSTLPSYLVTNLCNQAYIHVWQGNVKKALPLLQDALVTRRKLGWWDDATALTLWYTGDAHLFSSSPSEAEQSAVQAIEIMRRCTPRHFNNVHVRLTLAHALMVQGRLKEAEVVLQEAVGFVACFKVNTNNQCLLTAFEHLILMRELKEDFSDIYRCLIQEAQRLADLYKDSKSIVKYVHMQQKISQWRQYFVQATSTTGRTGQDQTRTLKNFAGDSVYSCDLQWGTMFTCEYCKMLKYNHRKWQQVAVM